MMLRPLGRGKQPSKVNFSCVGMWIRLYDLPIAIRSEEKVKKIAEYCGQVVDVDKQSLEGFGRSIRVKVNLDISKPLKKGVKIEH